MTISALLQLRLRGTYRIRNLKLVQDWWPKPCISSVPKKYWGTKWTNGCGLIRKYECRSHSAIGFHSRKPQTAGLPGNECFAYGETPEQAYDRWCELFKAWNKQEQWVK